ncbi:cadherin-like domain-containing protein, partial [Candidatus Bipolaricaulota bacterium]|nr:cadherin-like domain-containing protein [Candidatus Bipolaricaulota bacterium]
MENNNLKFSIHGLLSILSFLIIISPFALANTGLVARKDRATTLENNPVTIDVLANDSGVGTTPTVTISKGPQDGTVSVNPNNTITYTPDEGFFGNDSFRYRVENADGEKADALVIIEVGNVNKPPKPEDDLIITHEGETVEFKMKARDDDIDIERRFKHPVDFSIYSGPKHGKLTGNVERVGYEDPNKVFVEFTYTPEEGFKGIDAVIFEVEDAEGAKNFGTITIDVIPKGKPLTALSGYFDNKVGFSGEEGLLSSFSSKSSFTYEIEDFEVKIDSTFGMNEWSSLRTKLQFPFGLANVSSTFSFYPEADPPFNFSWNNSTSLSLGEVDFTHIFNFSPTPGATYSQFKFSWANQGVQHKASIKFDTVVFKFAEFNVQSIYELEDCSASLSTNLSLSDEGFDDFSLDVKEIPLFFNFYMDASVSFADLEKEVSTSFKYKSEWMDCFKLLIEPIV